ncbi:small ribosomal subunit protein uS17m [Monosporozyma unispora]|nr:hypothetical protein C6P44_000014 [Kazachstania unispora]
MARQNFVGIVVSQGKMQKTVKVRVERKVFNKRINKELLSRKDYLVHDENEISKEGDMVRIEATRPLSKWKFFAIAEILRNKGQQFAHFESMAKTDVIKEEAQKSKEFLDKRSRQNEMDSNMIKDIRSLQMIFNQKRDSNNVLSTEQNKELERIKTKYSIEEFSPNSLKKLLNLNLMAIESDLETQKDKIDIIQKNLEILLKDDIKSFNFLKEHGVEDPNTLQKNIRKNLIRKYLFKEMQL